MIRKSWENLDSIWNIGSSFSYVTLFSFNKNQLIFAHSVFLFFNEAYPKLSPYPPDYELKHMWELAPVISCISICSTVGNFWFIAPTLNLSLGVLINLFFLKEMWRVWKWPCYDEGRSTNNIGNFFSPIQFFLCSPVILGQIFLLKRVRV